ncbi:pentatricopeptide repeat-containing protein [Fagus crenata]
MIACFANNGFDDEELALFQQMQLKGIKPDDVIMLSVISAVSGLGALELGHWVDTFVRKSGLELTVTLGTALIDMFLRCSSIDQSIRVFDEFPGEIAWPQWIALNVFYEMNKSGLHLDCTTIIGVLVACSHGGLVEDGWRVFKTNDFVEAMPMKPNSFIWRTLLGACVNHNHIKLAEKVKQRISELDPYHDGDYVILSNAYGGVGKWALREGMRNSMREK